MTINQLILGDNLEILKKIETETLDLIYLDPPFFSNRNYEVIWGDSGEVRSFQDRWSGGIDHYIAWLKERVVEMHRILKPTGSLFLHCDWHANAYIRVDILDKVFGFNNLRGEIIWQRTNAHNDAKKKLAVLTDTIWYYAKTDKSTYNPVYGKLDEKYVEDFYKYQDEKGRYSLGDLTNTKPGGYNYAYKGYKPNTNGWRCPLETMQKWDAENLIYYPQSTTQRLRIKRYLNNSKGSLIGNIWADIYNVQPGKERIGYPTQKPNALLQRIIEMSSNENDIILDPFVGGGTTVAVADRLNRRWIGIDQSVQAVKVTELRLQRQQDLFSKPFTVQLHKYDYDTLRYKDAFEFEEWIVQQFGGTPNPKKRGDLGIDGRTKDNTPIQIKRSDDIGRNVIDNFLSAVQRYDKNLFEQNKTEKKPIGYVIAFSFGKGAIQEVARLKNTEGVIIKLQRVDEIVPIAKKPSLKVAVRDYGTPKDMPKDEGTLFAGVREIELTAEGKSEAGIEFYAWDFDYKAEKGFRVDIMIDKEGVQVRKFKPGTYQIAIKVVDALGLDNIEVIKLKVNGQLTIV